MVILDFGVGFDKVALKSDVETVEGEPIQLDKGGIVQSLRLVAVEAT